MHQDWKKTTGEKWMAVNYKSDEPLHSARLSGLVKALISVEIADLCV